MLRGGKNFKLSQAIRGKQVTLLILFICVIAGAGILGYVWSQTDAQIDRGSKIGITVAFSSIIVANLIGLVITGSSKLFSLETASTGYRYPAGIRYLLYALSITLGTLCIVIVSTNQITDKTTQSALAVTTGLFSVLSGLMGLYFHSSLLPVDFEALSEYSKKQGIGSIFTKDLFLDPEFATVLSETNFPSEVQDLLIQTHNTGDYSTFLQTLRDLNLDDILAFKTKLLVGPAGPQEGLLEKARAKIGKLFEKKEEDLLQFPEPSLLQKTREKVGKLLEKKPKPKTEQDQVLDFAKDFFNKQNIYAINRVNDLEKQFDLKGFTGRPYYESIKQQLPLLAKQSTIDAFKKRIQEEVASGKAPADVLMQLSKNPVYQKLYNADKSIVQILSDYAKTSFDPSLALKSIQGFVSESATDLSDFEGGRA